MKQEVINFPNRRKNSSDLIGSRKRTSGQPKVWEDLNFLLPRKLIEEIHKFQKENSIAITSTIHGPKQHCCDKCLKAHVFKLASEIGLNQNVLMFLEQTFPGEIGHNGYYINKEQLVPL